MTTVVDMKGSPMQTPTIIEDTPPTTAEQAIANFFQAVVDMHNACNSIDLSRAHFRSEGKIYSSAAVMRMIDRHMNFIRARMGGNYQTSAENTTTTTNQRR